MDYSQAKNKVVELYSSFRVSKDNRPYEMLKTQDVLDIFYPLQQRLPGNEGALNVAFAYFLAFTIGKFDRFGALRLSDSDELYSNFTGMLAALMKTERGSNRLSWAMQMTAIMWKAYRKLTNKAITEADNGNIDAFIAELNKIKVMNPGEEDSAIVERRRHEVKSRINAFRNDVRTETVTTLPYKLTRKDSSFHLICRGIEVDVRIENTLTSSPFPKGIELAEGSTVDEMGLSKNSYARSKLTLCFHALIDGFTELESVSYSATDEFGWDYFYDFTFAAVKSIWAYLQSLGDEYVTWPPLPQDLGTIKWRILTSDGVIDSGTFTNRATGFCISSEKRGVQHHEIGEATPLPWADNAYYYARLYAKAGQFQESAFWINVAAEALVDEFISEVAPDSQTYAELIEEENKFQTAEEILTEQFPEMSGKVTWPDTRIHASVYTKIKRALRLVNQEKSGKEIIKLYSKISRKRNSLFHGSDHDIDAANIAEMIQSYLRLSASLRGGRGRGD